MNRSCFPLRAFYLLLLAGSSLLPLTLSAQTGPTVETTESLPTSDPKPPATPATPTPSPSTPDPTATPSTPPEDTAQPPEADNPTPSDEFSQKVLPAEPTKKTIPTRSGDLTGTVWMGHRAVIDRYAGWGWLKKEKEPWNRARWIMIEETIDKSVAPGRQYSRPTEDDGMTYRLYGDLADYKGYEPNYDVFVDVFRIRGWEAVGKEKHPGLRPPRSSSGGKPGWAERGANLRR